MTPLWLNTMLENSESVATCTPYEVAPLVAVQIKVGLTETPVALFSGEDRTGAATTDVKFQTVDQSLVNPAFVVFIRQKYFVLLTKFSLVVVV